MIRSGVTWRLGHGNAVTIRVSAGSSARTSQMTLPLVMTWSSRLVELPLDGPGPRRPGP